MKILRRFKLVCSLMLCMSLCMTACGGESTSDNDAISGESVVFHITRDQEWVYVPEVITVGDEHADYERMQLVGDTFCYASQEGEEADSAKSIWRYSLTDGELESVPVIWPEGGDNWDLGARFFTQEQCLYITANVYPADYSSMKRFLCKLDPERRPPVSVFPPRRAGVASPAHRRCLRDCRCIGA